MDGVLAGLVAFVAEHQRCGELDGGRDNGYVWISCTCGGKIVSQVKAPESTTAHRTSRT